MFWLHFSLHSSLEENGHRRSSFLRCKDRVRGVGTREREHSFVTAVKATW